MQKKRPHLKKWVRSILPGIRSLFRWWFHSRAFGLLMVVPPGGRGGNPNRYDEQIVARVLMQARAGLKKALLKRSQTRPPGVPLPKEFSTDLYFDRQTGSLIDPRGNIDPTSVLRIRLMLDPHDQTLHVPSRLVEDLIHYLGNTPMNLAQHSVIQGILKLQGKPLGRITGGFTPPDSRPSQPYVIQRPPRTTPTRASTEVQEFLPEVAPEDYSGPLPDWWGIMAEGIRRVHQMDNQHLTFEESILDYLNPGVYEGFVILNPNGRMVDAQLAKMRFGEPLEWEDQKAAMKKGTPFKIYMGADGQLLDYEMLETINGRQSEAFQLWKQASGGPDGVPPMLRYFPYLLPMIRGEGMGRLILDFNTMILQHRRPTGNYITRLLLVDRGDTYEWAPFPKKGQTIPHLKYASFDVGFSPPTADKEVKRGSFIFNHMDGEIPPEVKKLLNYLVDLIH